MRHQMRAIGEFICAYKTKVRWIFQVFLTPQKSTALFYFFNDNGY
ncbi:hypothetical protein HMPREF9065_01438 [Aggregatibacter sp. oral taxon 458 str. W10330]|nr:hypothetical protein HMPREF9065_01438 [Aggregatibacter sp. oral taxon 458 str. W10330]